MNILEVNVTDLPGRVFNGYDLMNELNKDGFNVNQLVINKYSTSESVHVIEKHPIEFSRIRALERKYSIVNLLYTCAKTIVNMPVFKKADLVHYHILHGPMVSILDYEYLMGLKPSVWTIHDPWIFTGNCIHPMECKKWITGCKNCDVYDNSFYKMDVDNTRFMWEAKREALKNVNPYIVISGNFMNRFLKKSPMASHFNKVYTIPFGINTEKYDLERKKSSKRKIGTNFNKIVIGFREDDVDFKGCKYLYEALKRITNSEAIQLLSVGGGIVPAEIEKNYEMKRLGWINDESAMVEFYEACDIFVMPSLGESFGMMAVEAMAAGCAIVCFKDTAVEINTKAPDIGVAVEYKSSEALGLAIEKLVNSPEEVVKRGRAGHKYVKEHFRFEDYVKAHKALYEEIMKKVNI